MAWVAGPGTLLLRVARRFEECLKLVSRCSPVKHWGANEAAEGPRAVVEFLDGVFEVPGDLDLLDTAWCSEHAPSDHSRAKHEHKALADILLTAISRDGLNVENWYFVERVVQRVGLIQRAQVPDEPLDRARY